MALPLSPGALFVGDLSVCCRDSHLYELFEPFGRIVKAEIKYGLKAFKLLGYGFVTFETAVEAKAAMMNLNGILLLGRHLRISWASNASNLSEEICAEIAFSFISKQITNMVYEQTIRDLFSSYGCDVVDVAIKTYKIDQAGRKQSGTGFIHFPMTFEGVLAVKRSVDALANVTIKDVMYDCEISKKLQGTMRNHPELNPPYISTRPAIMGRGAIDARGNPVADYNSPNGGKRKPCSVPIDIGCELPYMPLSAFEHMLSHSNALLAAAAGTLIEKVAQGQPIDNMNSSGYVRDYDSHNQQALQAMLRNGGVSLNLNGGSLSIAPTAPAAVQGADGYRISVPMPQPHLQNQHPHMHQVRSGGYQGPPQGHEYRNHQAPPFMPYGQPRMPPPQPGVNRIAQYQQMRNQQQHQYSEYDERGMGGGGYDYDPYGEHNQYPQHQQQGYEEEYYPSMHNGAPRPPLPPGPHAGGADMYGRNGAARHQSTPLHAQAESWEPHNAPRPQRPPLAGAGGPSQQPPRGPGNYPPPQQQQPYGAGPRVHGGHHPHQQQQGYYDQQQQGYVEEEEGYAQEYGHGHMSRGGGMPPHGAPRNRHASMGMHAGGVGDGFPPQGAGGFAHRMPPAHAQNGAFPHRALLKSTSHDTADVAINRMHAHHPQQHAQQQRMPSSLPISPYEAPGSFLDGVEDGLDDDDQPWDFSPPDNSKSPHLYETQHHNMIRGASSYSSNNSGMTTTLNTRSGSFQSELFESLTPPGSEVKKSKPQYVRAGASQNRPQQAPPQAATQAQQGQFGNSLSSRTTSSLSMRSSGVGADWGTSNTHSMSFHGDSSSSFMLNGEGRGEGIAVESSNSKKGLNDMFSNMSFNLNFDDLPGGNVSDYSTNLTTSLFAGLHSTSNDAAHGLRSNASRRVSTDSAVSALSLGGADFDPLSSVEFDAHFAAEAGAVARLGKLGDLLTAADIDATPLVATAGIAGVDVVAPPQEFDAAAELAASLRDFDASAELAASLRGLQSPAANVDAPAVAIQGQ